MDAVVPLTGQVVALLAPFLPELMKAGQALAERASNELGAEGRELATAVWNRLSQRIDERPAAQEAARDVAANPKDEDMQAAFRVQLRKLLTEDPALLAEVRRTLEEGQKGGTNTVTASGAGAVAIGRDASGSTIITGDQNQITR
jgi:hypothetical protein